MSVCVCNEQRFFSPNFKVSVLPLQHRKENLILCLNKSFFVVVVFFFCQVNRISLSLSRVSLTPPLKVNSDPRAVRINSFHFITNPVKLTMQNIVLELTVRDSALIVTNVSQKRNK